jgi:hypothetical protein
VSWGKNGRDVATTTTPSSFEVNDRVEIYLYSPLGIRVLYYGEVKSIIIIITVIIT